jgi:hypothetical protein
MTGEEVERAIETLLENQATFETQLQRTNQQIEQTNRRLEMHAESQTEFIQVVLKHIESQGEINASVRSAVQNLTSIVETLSKRNGSGGS